MMKSVRSRKCEWSQWIETGEPSVKWSSKTEVERTMFCASSWMLVWMSLSNATNCARDLICVLQELWVLMSLMTSFESVRWVSRWRFLPRWLTSISERCSVW